MIKSNLKHIMVDKKMSLKKIAEATNIRYGTLYNFANDKVNTANHDILDKLCEFLDVTVGDLIKYIPDKKE